MKRIENSYKQYRDSILGHQNTWLEILIRQVDENSFEITSKKIASRFFEQGYKYCSVMLHPTFDTNSSIYPYDRVDYHINTRKTDNNRHEFLEPDEFLKEVGYESFSELFVYAHITVWNRDPLERLITAIIEEIKLSDGKTLPTDITDSLDKWFEENRINYTISTYHVNDYCKICYLIKMANINNFKMIEPPKPEFGYQSMHQKGISNNEYKEEFYKVFDRWENYIQIESYLHSEYLFYNLLKK